jgi:ubiquinone biosynthesis protein COQ9
VPQKTAELDEALTHAAAAGFTAALVEDWSGAVDAAMTARLATLDLKSLPVRKRIRTAVLTRLAILQPHKLAARRAVLFLALPVNAALALRLLARTADVMWRAAGDTATDFNWYTKRVILGAVYAATEIAWFGDDTPDGGKTEAFFDARIESVMQYEKLKARLRTACQPTEKSAR